MYLLRCSSFKEKHYYFHPVTQQGAIALNMHHFHEQVSEINFMKGPVSEYVRKQNPYIAGPQINVYKESTIAS